MELNDTVTIATAGLKAQTERLKVVAQNIANADSVATTKGGQPYKRQTISFENAMDKESGVKLVKVKKIGVDKAEPIQRYEPNNPLADEKGIVLYPNISRSIEMVDMQEAQRTYEANLNMIEASKAMISQTVNLLQ
jgi:flagellar basal-body rod protein FlgC